MKKTTVYDLLKARAGDSHVARLVQALDELAARYETITGYSAAPAPPQLGDLATSENTGKTSVPGSKPKIRRHADRWDLAELQLPDPSSGALPLFPGTSEFDALQLAAAAASSQLRSKSERHALRSWLMSPHHFVCVVQAAWLLLALVFKQDDPQAKHVQDFVFKQLSQQYVTQCLGAKPCVENAAVLWTQAIADAACRVLRSAFPGNTELQVEQLQPLLQRQLRLWTTGVLPSDAAASILLQADQQNDDGQNVAAALARKHTKAPFASMKPSPLVSSYLSSRGINPTTVANKPGLKVTELTVPHDHLQKAQQQHNLVQQTAEQPGHQQQRAADHLSGASKVLQQVAKAMQQATTTINSEPGGLQQQRNQQQGSKVANCIGSASSVSPDPHHQQRQPKQHSGNSIPTAQQLRAATCNSKPVRNGASADTGSASGNAGGHVAAAAACLAAAASAAEQYQHNKQTAARAAHKGMKVVQGQLRQLQQKRSEILLGTRAGVQAASNSVTGWLGDTPEGPLSASMPAAVTDAQCKSQRQLMQGQLRHGEWRMAHTFNRPVHDRCLDLAAAVAASTASDVSKAGGSPEASRDVVGGKWAALASSSAMSSNYLKAKAAAGNAAAAASVYTGIQHVKATRAAKAIAADVQQKYAA